MARGAMAIAETREEAEQQFLKGASQLRVLRSREIDLSGLPPLAGGLPKHWVVVVEHSDPEEEAKLEQHEDPEEHCERATRQMYLSIATDPDLLVTGVIEQFTCPACGEEIQIELPAPRQRRDPGHSDCPECGTHLARSHTGDGWEVFDPPPKTPVACIFCEAKADSMEHVIPGWISRQLGIRKYLYPDGPPRRGDVGRASQPISFASFRARIFCKGCNRHFKDLEDDVIPLIVAMARGRSVSLDRETQALLARWAGKTAIALLATDPKLRQVVPVQHRRLIREEGRLANDIVVGLFTWRGEPVISIRHGGITSRRGENPGRSAYAALLAFAGFGFFVTGSSDPVGPGEVIDAERPPMHQFWPPRTPLFHWPPRMAADERIVPHLDRWVPLRRP
jgi:predicted RNA-binding Zn-ribbon protein involved in translation (DUF1610 family)